MSYTDLLRDLNIRLTGVSERFKRLDLLERFLKGTQYDELQHCYYDTYSDIGAYVPLRERKPSVKYNIAKVVIDRATDMLFGDQHFPAPHIEDSEDKLTEDFLKVIIKESLLDAKWKFASTVGSVGSVFIVFKLLNGRFYHEVLLSKNCTPVWDFKNPGDLESVREEKIVPGEDLVPFGYFVDPSKSYYYRRDFTKTSEIEYFPVEFESVEKNGIPIFIRNDERSFDHKFGFVPGVWVKNLPSDDAIDGQSTHEAILDFSKEIDYQLSQIGRAYYYAGDPTLAIYDPSQDEEGEAIVKTSANALLLNKESEAEYLEIEASAQENAKAYVETLRKFALEVARGTRIDPDKLSASQSGKALALLHKDIIGLVSDLRISYGTEGLIPYFKKIIRAAKKSNLKYSKLTKLFKSNNSSPEALNEEASITLRWGPYFEPTAEDDRATFEALTAGVSGTLISRDRAVRAVADRYDIEDVGAEIAQIDKEQKAKLKMIQELDMAQQASQVAKGKQL